MDAIIFVYNADSGFFNKVTDYLHKTLSPETYQCQLCAITHSHKMHDKWRIFVENLPIPVEFLHRDELISRYQISDVQLPAIFSRTADQLTVRISAAQIDTAKSLAALKQMVNEILV